MTLRPARELAHAALADANQCLFEPVSKEWPNGYRHEPECDALTAAIEARDREVVEAAAKIVTASAECHAKGAAEAEANDDLDGLEVAEAIEAGLAELATRIRAIAKETTT